MSHEVKISTRGLRKCFNGRVVLEHVDLDIRAGESHVIVGLSGTGKSVLLKCILGLLSPDAGTVWINGEDWSKLDEDQKLARMRCIGVVFQGSALFDSLPVWENVAFVLLRHGMPQSEARTRAEEVLEWVGLPGIGDKMPAELSGGMKKRVGLARAICHRPDIILYDEPLTGLDPVMADAILRLMSRLHEELQVTSLTISHNMNLVRRFSDRVSMLYEGRIHQQLHRDEIDACTDPVFRQFVMGSASGPIQVQGMIPQRRERA